MGQFLETEAFSGALFRRTWAHETLPAKDETVFQPSRRIPETVTG
jgi:hypothetical protein